MVARPFPELTYLERDIPQFGPRIPAETLRRFWTMLAHAQGGTFIEIKRSLSPTVEKGFHQACQDTQATRRLVVYPGSDCFPIRHDTEVVSLEEMMREVKQAR